MDSVNEEIKNEEESKSETVQEVGSTAVMEKGSKTAGARILVNGGYIQTSLNESDILKSWPDFSVGDTVKVHYKIKEGDKERIQLYEGNVISIRGSGLGKTFIVRRTAHDVGVERIFPYHSPFIANLEVVRRGVIRRAKLFYLRSKSGKAGRIKEKIVLTGKEKVTKKKVAAKKKPVAKKKAASKKKSSSKAKSTTSKKK